MVRYAKRSTVDAWTRGDKLHVKYSVNGTHLRVTGWTDAQGVYHPIRSSVHPDDVQLGPVYYET